MKFVKEILTNPISIAVMIVHWLVVIFAITFEDSGLFDDRIVFHRSDTLFQWIVLLNYPSLIVIEALVFLINQFYGKIMLVEILLIPILIFLVTLQWLLIGFLVSKIFNLVRSEEVEILLDEK